MVTASVVSFAYYKKTGKNLPKETISWLVKQVKRVVNYISSRRETIGLAAATSLTLDVITGLIFGILGGAMAVTFMV